ncbi:MAG: DUF21 domain-containing protein [Verrucomicrobiota bacterium]
MNTDWLNWLGIFACLSQSAIFSGLNIGLFSLSKLRLEAEADSGSREAIKILSLRKRSNLLLATILWGNVGANCLLTLLSDSVLAGVGAFLFSTVAITIMGEIIPQAYFSRHALRIGAFLAPVIRFYMFLLWPIVAPTSWVLNRLVGEETLTFFKEKDLQYILQKHTEEEGSDIGEVEGRGAMNFLHLDDITVSQEGEIIDPKSIIHLPTADNALVFPEKVDSFDDPFIHSICACDEPWVIIVDEENRPRLVLDADGLIRDIGSGRKHTYRYYCHRPIIVENPNIKLDQIIARFHVDKTHAEDDVIDDDIVLYWGENQKRIITGADILGRLLRGVVNTRESRA